MILKTFSLTYKGFNLKISAKYRKNGANMLFFIHGLGCTKDVFDDVWNIEALKKFSIITFDLPGFGDSTKPKNFPYTMEDHSMVCKDLINFFPEKKIHIVAHSMGAAVALLLAENIKEKLISFVNIEGNLIGSDCGVSRKAENIPPGKFHQNVVKKLQLLSLSSTEKGPGLWLEWIKRSAPYALKKSSESLVKWSDSGLLLKIFLNLKCRKAYFYGEKNNRLRTLLLLDEIRTVPVTKSGHFPMNDNPSDFYIKLANIIN